MAYAPHLEEASRKYRPRPIRLLFIAEAPPALESGRFFYLTSLTTGDTLFLEMMKVLYPTDTGFAEREDHQKSNFDAKRIRQRKKELLEKFKRDGFYLIDASEQPMPKDADAAIKTRIIRTALPALREKVRKLCGDRDVPVILIGGVTYSVCAAALRDDQVHILNDGMIDHPARGGQKRFRRKLRKVIHKFSVATSD
jgi:hypothetical protein